MGFERGFNGLSDWTSAKKHGMRAQTLIFTCQRTLVPARAAVHLQHVHCLHMLYLSCHIHIGKISGIFNSPRMISQRQCQYDSTTHQHVSAWWEHQRVGRRLEASEEVVSKASRVSVFQRYQNAVSTDDGPLWKGLDICPPSQWQASSLWELKNSFTMDMIVQTSTVCDMGIFSPARWSGKRMPVAVGVAARHGPANVDLQTRWAALLFQSTALNWPPSGVKHLFSAMRINEPSCDAASWFPFLASWSSSPSGLVLPQAASSYARMQMSSSAMPWSAMPLSVNLRASVTILFVSFTFACVGFRCLRCAWQTWNCMSGLVCFASQDRQPITVRFSMVFFNPTVQLTLSHRASSRATGSLSPHGCWHRPSVSRRCDQACSHTRTRHIRIDSLPNPPQGTSFWARSANVPLSLVAPWASSHRRVLAKELTQRQSSLRWTGRRTGWWHSVRPCKSCSQRQLSCSWGRQKASATT